jgi:hypothetical protein
MAAPVERGVTAPALDDSGIATSPSGTVVDDLVLVLVWSQNNSVIPTHALDGSYTEIFSHPHNDGSTDGRLSLAGKLATVAGAQTYQPYTVSDAAAGQTTATCYVLQGQTFSAISTWPTATTVTATGNGAPNPPTITGLTGDFRILAIGAWHVTSAASTVTGEPSSYTERTEGPSGSHVTHVNISARDRTGLSAASEDPGSFSDNVTPNGTVGATVAMRGVSEININGIESAEAFGSHVLLDEFRYPYTAAQMASAVGYGTWSSGYLLNGASGVEAPIFGTTPPAEGVGSPTYQKAGPFSTSKTIGLSHDSYLVASTTTGFPFDVPDGEDFALFWIAKHDSPHASQSAPLFLNSDFLSIYWNVLLVESTAGGGTITAQMEFIGGSTPMSTAALSVPVGSWYIGGVVLTDLGGSGAKLRIGVIPMFSGSATTSAEASVGSWLGNETLNDALYVGAGTGLLYADSGAFDLDCFWILKGATGAAGSMSTNLATALTNLRTYLTTQYVDASGIATEEALGSATIQQAVEPSGVVSDEAFGAPTLAITIDPLGVTSDETFGAALIDTGSSQYVDPSGIPSDEVFGSPDVQLAIDPSGILSDEAFGTSLLATTIDPSGVPSDEVFGNALIAVVLYLYATSVVSEEAFGNHEVEATLVEAPSLHGAGHTPQAISVTSSAEVLRAATTEWEVLSSSAIDVEILVTATTLYKVIT